MRVSKTNSCQLVDDFNSNLNGPFIVMCRIVSRKFPVSLPRCCSMVATAADPSPTTGCTRVPWTLLRTARGNVQFCGLASAPHCTFPATTVMYREYTPRRPFGRARFYERIGRRPICGANNYSFPSSSIRLNSWSRWCLIKADTALFASFLSSTVQLDNMVCQSGPDAQINNLRVEALK